MYVSIDLVVDVIERQIPKHKTRLMNQKYDGTTSNRNLWSRKTMWKMMRSESSEARSLLSNLCIQRMLVYPDGSAWT